MVTPWWASILSLFLKLHFPSATQNMNKNIPGLSLGMLMSLHWCLQLCGWHLFFSHVNVKTPMDVNSARCSTLFTSAASKHMEVSFSSHSWKSSPRPVMLLTYLFHPGHYILPQSQLMALDFSQPQAFPNLSVWEPDLFGSPQSLFRNCFTGIKYEKHLCMRLYRKN